MLKYDSLRSAGGRTEATTRSRLLHVAATVAATAPLATLTAGGAANAADWPGKLGAAVHIAHGAGHYMTKSPGPVLDTIHVLSHRTLTLTDRALNARADT